MTFGKPRPLTINEIEDIVNRFAFAAKVLRDVSLRLEVAERYILELNVFVGRSRRHSASLSGEINSQCHCMRIQLNKWSHSMAICCRRSVQLRFYYRRASKEIPI